MDSLLTEKHVEFIQKEGSDEENLHYWLTEHLRMAGIYWGLCTLFLLRREDALDRSDVVKFVLSCRKPDGGFGAAPRHDSHILSTLYAVQILFMYDALDSVDVSSIANYVCNLQDPVTGAVWGDEFGEIDTRFVYAALQCLKLLGKLDQFRVELAAEFLLKCANFDGGFGLVPGAESHAAQVFTCVAGLALCNRLHRIDGEKLGWWLSERQVPGGGFNGRPEKLPDVCYSWWVGSSLAILGKLEWIDKQKLRKFILSAQDPEKGGIADRMGDETDIYHTCFGIAGLSLLGTDELEEVDPVYCLPRKFTKKLEG